METTTETNITHKVERQLFVDSSDEEGSCYEGDRAGVSGTPSPPAPASSSKPPALAPSKPGALVRPWEHSPKDNSPTASPKLNHNRLFHMSSMTRESTPSPQDWTKMAADLSPPQTSQTVPLTPGGMSSTASEGQELLAMLISLLSQPQHAQWAQGLYMWYQYELQRLHAHHGYLAMLAPAAQHRDIQTSLAALSAQITSHTRMVIHSYLQATQISKAHLTSTPIPHSRVPSIDSDNPSEISHTSVLSEDSAYASPASLSPSPPRDNHHYDNGTPANKRSLPTKAIQMMEKWYQANFDHPYPTNAMVQHFAEAGGITVQQVKKWMANKRVRSLNTLSYNGSIHPKRLQRMMREREAAQSVRVSPYPKNLSESSSRC